MLNFDQIYVQFFNLGVMSGSWIQGVTISNSNINFNTFGLQTPSGAGGVLGQLSVTNSQFANYSNNVTFLTGVAATMFSNNLLLIRNNTSGIICQPCGSLTATGNTFEGEASPSGSAGIVDFAGSGAVIVTGNVFTLLTSGFSSNTGATTCNVQSNIYHVVTNPIYNGGSCTIGGGTP